MEEITLYTVVLTATYVCEAGSTQQAEERANAYWATHLDEANHAVTSRTGWKEEEED